MDKVIGMVETREKLPGILKNISLGKRYIITQRSKAKAAIISLEELESLEILADRELLKEIKEAKEDIKEGRYKSYQKYFGETL